MKKIAASGIFWVKLTPTGGTPMGTSELRDLAVHNKIMVIESAITTERILVNIISKFFFESPPESAYFEEMVLNSDGYTFSEKLKIVQQILIAQRLAGPNDKFFQDLHKVMHYRNRFTHGILEIDPPKVWLQYFDKKLRSKELTDEYLTEVESALKKAQEAAEKFRDKVKKHPLALMKPQELMIRQLGGGKL